MCITMIRPDTTCRPAWSGTTAALPTQPVLAHHQRLADRAAASRRRTHAAAGHAAGAAGAAAAAAAAVRRQRRRPALHRPGTCAAAAEQAASATSDTADTAAALASLCYTSPDGRWQVRPLNKGDSAEVQRIVALQTNAFHTPPPLAALDGLTKSFFKAEVLSEMQKKIKFNPDDLFCSLVLEPAGAARLGGSGSSGSDVEASSAAREASSSGGAHPGVVGVVEISYVNNKETLALLPPGTQGYCYVASMVVAPAWRRRGGAQALLRAAELAAEAWDEQQAVLHVYQDNDPAVQAYKAAGYEVLHSLNKLFARPRHVMIKRW